MKKLYHNGIFYPDNKETLKALATVPGDKEGAKALLVPHQELTLCADLIREAFRYRGNPEKVVILVPIHNHRLERDKDSVFFEGELLPESSMISLGATKAEWYSEEEPAAELLLPFLEENLPGVPFGILYADVVSAKDSKALASFLSKLDTENTLFILSSNLTERTKSIEDTQKWKACALDALLEGGYFLDKMNKNTIRMCGGGILDAFQRLYPTPWILISQEDGDTITGHASFYKEK